jgi:protein SCO1/2
MSRWLSALAAAPLLFLNGCSLTSGLPTYGKLPNFKLEREDGRVFDRTEVAGHVWVANFIFTRCTGPCPRMSRQMKQIQDALGDVKSVLLVSLTIDPAYDTPEVLQKYSAQVHADPARWFFVTGEAAELRKLSKDTFFLGDIGPPFEHSTRFVLIDRMERIRGFYDSSDPAAMKDLMRHIDQLQRDKF